MKIVHYPHPALRCKCRPIQAIDAELHKTAARMLELMYEAHGLGLAAPQVGLPYQLFVMNPLSDPEQRDLERVLVNPVIVDHSRTLVEGEEGCLSFPDLFQKVRRYKSVKVRYYDLAGQLVEIEASDLPARVLQHERDHLDGTLFIDKMGPIGRLSSRAALKEFEYRFKKAQEKGEIPPDSVLERQLRRLLNEEASA
jgi:peptide deformylase